MNHTLPPNSADWDSVGDTYYRKQEIYQMSWSISDLSSYKVVGASLGGPIAISLDTSKPIPLIGDHLHLSSTTKPKLYIYSSSGQSLFTIIWDHPSDLISFGFTKLESLIILSSDGFYRIYPLHSNSSTFSSSTSSSSTSSNFTQHSLGSVTEELGVIDGQIWSDGMVVMRSDLSFLQVKGWPEEIEGIGNEDGGRLDSIESGGLTDRPNSWAVISPKSSNTGVIQILVSRSDSIVVIDPMDSTDQRLSSKGPYERILPSPNGKFLALLTSASSPSPFTVWVVSSDFSRELSEYSLPDQHAHDLLIDGPPTQMVWCGGDTVIVGWEKSLVMIGPFGASFRYSFTDPIHLIEEIDGVRIITSHTCEFLSKVGPSTISVFRPGSTSPAAILFDALDHFDKRSARVSDEHIRNIKKQLKEAVNVCIKASGDELEIKWQERLLRTASFGKSFLDVYNPEGFVKMAKTLRVLNAVRHYEIGIPLTYEQYMAHHPSHLIYRLTARAHYLLALRITEFLGLSPAPVLKQWARSLMMNTHLNYEAQVSKNQQTSLCEKIVKKLKGKKGIGASDIAEIAWNLGKNQLSIQLLSYEIRPIKQIPLLMKMNQDEEGLKQSIKSLDPDLLQSVLWEIRRKKSLAEFLGLIEGKEEAISCLRIWAKKEVNRNLNRPNQLIKPGPDWELFKDFCFQDDRRSESGCLALEESHWNGVGFKVSLSSSSFALPMNWNEFWNEKIGKKKIGMNFFKEDSNRRFEEKMIKEEIQLIEFQKRLIEDLMNNFPSTSTTNLKSKSEEERQLKLIKLGLKKQAEKLSLEFKVNERRYWYLKLKALVEIKDWIELEAWSAKKNPIGFEPFVHQLLLMGCNREALKYVKKCEMKNRIELYIKCGEWIIAGEECADRGEMKKLIELKQRCPNPMISNSLGKMIDDLTV
ncbi:Vps16, N-terminal region-domain-containing protein [Melampsora americana]|nr:Vps16, N-terminal region-domain-containing protein [Melampsora americana]